MHIEPVSSHALLIRMDEVISRENALNVRHAFNAIRKIEGVREIVPSYTTLLVTYDIALLEYEYLKTRILEELNHTEEMEHSDELVVIDVYYGVEVGWDLERISSEKGIPLEQIIKCHSDRLYDVYAMGFLPGFGFLGSVDERIAMPRLSTPRPSVPKGSVAIADRQSAVYPQESAGGWNIIGRSAMELFDVNLPSLSPLGVGKKVRFNPVSKEVFLSQGGVL